MKTKWILGLAAAMVLFVMWHHSNPHTHLTVYYLPNGTTVT